MPVAFRAYGSNGSVIKGFNECEGMVVRKDELQAIVQRERDRITDTHSAEETDIQGFVIRMGFSGIDSYYKFMNTTKSDWISIDLADRILVGLGLHWLFNTGDITIYKIREGLAHPLA